ncbi:MAG: DNA-binding response regulator [Chloroflexi bacterium]|nr:MAG: DNA-binding response regulator [Chloroflexota bacterium]
MTIRLLVVDDHALFRAGLVSLLDDMPEIVVVGEAGDGKEAVEAAKRLTPDVILMDVNMPVMDGVEAVEALRRDDKKVHIIMLTISQHDDDLFGAIQAGAEGYLLKNAEPEDLRTAILNVYEGKAVLSAEVTRQVLRAVANIHGPIPDAGLSKREMEVLECLAQGKTTYQIATDLYVSENTIKTHIRHILEKLEAANRAEAVSKATQLGIIRTDR